MVSLLLAVAAAILATPAPRTADTRHPNGGPMALRSPAPRVRPIHFVYGSIVWVRGSSLLLLTRAHRQTMMDITQALATGEFSAPLVPGKPVVVVGDMGADRIFHAARITRLPQIDTSTEPDR